MKHFINRVTGFALAAVLAASVFPMAAYADEPVQNGENVQAAESQESTETKYSNTMRYARNTDDGIQLHWNRMEGVDGYLIYRKLSGTKSYKKTARVKSDNILYWDDEDVDAGKLYYYKVKGYIEDGEKDEVQAVSGDKKEAVVRAETVYPDSLEKTSDGIWELTWSSEEKNSGFEIQTADNRFFFNATSHSAADADMRRMEISDYPEAKEIYVRIRSLSAKGKTTSASSWGYSENVMENKTVSRRYWKNSRGTRIEWKSAAGQKLYQYDTFQGACSDGTYTYAALYNRANSKSKIVKIRNKDGKVVKKSAALSIHHANDMTYNADTGRVAIIHLTGYPMRVTMLDPDTMKITKNVTVEIPDSLYGAAAGRLSGIKGFSGIAYDSEHGRYVLAIKESKNLLICDKNLTPLRYVRTDSNGYTNQNLECTGDYILRAQSGRTNLVSIYDWEGNPIADLNTGKSFELEHVFFAGDVLHAGYYTSGYSTKKVKAGKKTVTRKYLYRNNYLAEMLLDL